MINTCRIPQHTGNFEELEKAASGLRTDAAGIRRNGSDVHSRFQMLAGVYVAPEAEDLFRTTQPVMDKSEVFATKLETVADALDTFAIEASPLADRLKVLKADAEAFFLSVADDDDWQDDDTKRDRHNALDSRIRQTVDAFQDSERRAANKIAALVGDVRFVGATGSDTVLRGMHDITYGIAPGESKDASKLPWGEPIAESHDAGDIGYWAKSFFWDGIVVDNVWGSLKGLGALVTGDGEAWKGLASIASGVSAWVSEPYDELMDATMGEDGEKDDDRNKKALKEFGKSLVAWDKWDDNPARASATVVFNGLTLGAGPLAAASRAGKGGAASKAASAAATAGTYLDPLSAGIVGTAKVSQALPRLAELTNHLRSTDALPAAPDPHTLLELGNSRVRVDGEFTVIDRQGRAVEHDIPQENTTHQRVGQVEGAREPVGVGANRSTEASARAGSAEISNPPSRPASAPARGDSYVVGSSREPGVIPRGSEEPTRRPASTGPEGQSGPGALERGSQGDASQFDDPPSGQERQDGEGENPHEGREGETGLVDESSRAGSGALDDTPANEPRLDRPALPPGQASLSLRDVRGTRGFRRRYLAGEEFTREMFGAGPEQHFPVSPQDHPYYPVELAGGRKVDAPVKLPGGGTLAIEVKNYLEFRTIKMSDGSKMVVKGEVPLTKDLMQQINKDLALRRANPRFDPRWVFLGAPPSQALRDYLIQARVIFVEYGPAPK